LGLILKSQRILIFFLRENVVLCYKTNIKHIYYYSPYYLCPAFFFSNSLVLFGIYSISFQYNTHLSTATTISSPCRRICFGIFILRYRCTNFLSDFITWAFLLSSALITLVEDICKIIKEGINKHKKSYPIYCFACM